MTFYIFCHIYYYMYYVLPTYYIYNKIKTNKFHITLTDCNKFTKDKFNVSIKKVTLISEFMLNEKVKTLATKEEIKTLATKTELKAEQDKINNYI